MDKEPKLKDLMNLLAPIADQYRMIAVQLNIEDDSIPGVHYSAPAINNLESILRYWHNNGNGIGSPVKWKTIIEAVESRAINNFKVADKIREFLQKEDTCMKYLSGIMKYNIKNYKCA